MLFALAFLVGHLFAPFRHNYDLKNVLWRLSFSLEERSIAGDVTNTLTLLENSPTIQLHCNDLQIAKVTVGGSDAKFVHEDGVLTVNLPHPGRTGETLDVRVVYSGHPGGGFYFVPGFRAFPAKTPMVYTQGEFTDNRNWLPTYDLPDDKATSESFITVPKTWTAVSNGRLVEVRETTTSKVFHWKMEQPASTYLISLVAGEYVQGHDAWHGIPVDYYVPPGLEAEGKAAFADTPKMIDYYSKLTGVDYPYAKFSQEVVAEFGIAGMENVSCVTLTIDALRGLGNEKVRDTSGLVEHELAHQWFGDLVTCETWDHEWINEGFASFLPLFYLRSTEGEDAYDWARYSTFESAIDSFGARNRKEVAGGIGSIKPPQVSVGSIYEGGASRMLMLMHQLKEVPFWQGIHRFLVDYSFKCATTDQFFQKMSDACGMDLSPFRMQWFQSPAPPSISARVADGRLTLSQLAPFYSLDLPVWFLDGETWVKQTIRLDGREATMPLGPMAGKPFLVDPEVWTLTELKYDAGFSPTDIAALYRHAPNAGQRGRIVREFFDQIPVAERIELARSETYAPLVQQILDKIGAEGAAFLLEETRHKDDRVVITTLYRLAGLPRLPGPEFRTRVEELMKSAKVEAVREIAARVLLKWTTTDGSVAAQVYRMTAFDDDFRRAAFDWWGNRAPDEARRRALLVLDHPDNEPLLIKAIQILGKVKDTPGTSRAYRALTQLSQGPPGPARDAANQALDQLKKG